MRLAFQFGIMLMVMLQVSLSNAFRPVARFGGRRQSLRALASSSSSSSSSKESAPAASTQYPFAEVEPKWQAYWEKHETFLTPERTEGREKKYVLDMFPYPSGAGLHVGHPEGYTGKYNIDIHACTTQSRTYVQYKIQLNCESISKSSIILYYRYWYWYCMYT